LPQEKYAVVAEEEPDILPIPLVPGLNVEAALKRLRGNRQLYRKLLDSYIPGYGDTSAKLLQEVQAGNWEDALRRVHSIKGVAGTLGSTALAAAAGKLEKVLRVAGSCDSPKLKKPLQGFFDRQEELVANIAAVLPRQLADAPAMPEGPPWDAAEMRLLLTRLKSALRSEEPLLCNKIMEELLQRPCPNDLHGVLAELGRLISRYRLAEALVLLENEFKDILV
jgi:HPt (histidine-containing phosphotransfer) domain-containing protein